MHISLTAELESQVKARQSKLSALREHLAVGEAQADRGEFVDQSMEEMLNEFKAELNDA